jgi:D-serine deaminase-like pyridoxal phosphate-dependent protein
MTAEDSHLWYTIDNSDGIDTPALVIYPERVRENIRTAITMVRDVSLLRPHAKTHKSPEATRLLLDEGIRKFKCATIAEAEMLAELGAPDVLIAYQPVGPKIERVLRLVERYPLTVFSCLVDDLSAARAIAAVFAAHHRTLPVFIDLNVGMNRTGIRPDAGAAELFAACDALDGISPAGLHAYDGHIGVCDPALRILECRTSFEPVRSLLLQLRDEGRAMPVIVAGGSPTFPVHAQRPGVECSPGTFIYWDKNYETQLPEQPFLPAALVITRVVSRPTASTLCLDAGYKAVASEKDINHRLWFVNAPDARVIGQSEEHLVIDVGDGHSFEIGNILYGIPYHICPTCALYAEAVTVRDQTADGVWTMTARNRTITI